MEPKILLPAFGREYKSAEEITVAYFLGKDFFWYNLGCYCSCRDFVNQEVNLKYGPGLYTSVTYEGV